MEIFALDLKLSWEARLGIILILLSLTIYGIKYLINGDAENIFNYIFNSLGYLPLNVLLVTLILNRLLANRSKQNKLEHRRDFQGLPDSDYLHLSGDIERAYFLLVMEWMAYMRYLNSNYPYLFSLAMRTNPFDENACVVVK